MFGSNADSDTDASDDKKKYKELCSCCTIKDHSPLGLLGILLITAGIIIAIFDAKDALPNKAASYVIGIGVVLIVIGVANVTIAFVGYRRTRALAREKTGTKITRRGRNRQEAFRTISLKTSSTNNAFLRDFEHFDISQKPKGPCLVYSPEDYGVHLCSEKDFYFHGFEGEDNPDFQKSPARQPPFTMKSSSSKIWTHTSSEVGPKWQTANLSPTNTEIETVQSIPVDNQKPSSDIPYASTVSTWPRLDLPNHMPPVSTNV